MKFLQLLAISIVLVMAGAGSSLAAGWNAECISASKHSASAPGVVTLVQAQTIERRPATPTGRQSTQRPQTPDIVRSAWGPEVTLGSPDLTLAQAQRTIRQRTVGIPSELRAALERGNRRQVLNVARRLGIATGGGVDRYVCTQSDCVCAGAADCVKMVSDGVCPEPPYCDDAGCQCLK
jgi:hypothetical protein